MNALKLSSHCRSAAAPWRRAGLALLMGNLAVFSCRAGGTVVAWGDNTAAQCQVPPGLTSVTTVAGGYLHSLALNSDGTVVAWGSSLFGQATVPPGLSNVVAISGGYAYSLALKADGTVVVFGSQPPAPAGLTNVTAIAAGWDHSLALKADGTVVAWGTQSNVPAGLTNLQAIAAGNGHSLGLRADGTVIAWGDNSFGKTNVPAGLANVVAIAAGQDHCLALRRNGTVAAWGGNYDGQTSVPSGLNTAVAIAAGALHSLALRTDGTLVAWGDNTYSQTTVNPTLTGFIAIAGGGLHSLAIRGDGFPVILMQPASQSVITTKNASFQVIAVGALPLGYQWQFNGTNISGATASTLTVRNVQLANGGAYTVIVSNTFATVTSAAAILTPVLSPPFVTQPPQNQTTICGDGASFFVIADGSQPFSYQWQFAGTAIPGATTTRLVLNNVNAGQAGPYAVVVSNAYGSVTSAVAQLTVQVQPPTITSPLTASGTQGLAFSYTITGLHTPVQFNARFLPAGLTINTNTGVISGTNLENGVFGPTIIASNACTSASATLVLSNASSVPVITGPFTVTGQEQGTISYQITATETNWVPVTYSGQNLPIGISIDPVTGLISGTPVYAGDFDSTISVSNAWGTGTTNVHFTFANAFLASLSIDNVTYSYSSPYLLDFQFSLSGQYDTTNSLTNAVVIDPHLLSVTSMEDGEVVSPLETAVLLQRGNAKVVKIYEVLDFTESVASMIYGDANSNGISDAIDYMVSGAKDFVNQEPPDTQIGVFEFHREDMDPQQVLALTTDKTLLDQSIAGIWTNYVQDFPAGSRCWDALVAAIKAVGSTNTDEQRYVVFVSDGRDESSTNTITDVVNAAMSNNVVVSAVGFGAERDDAALYSITAPTRGRYYIAAEPVNIQGGFNQIAKDLNSQYLLRWATLKRSTNAFTPSFSITYQGITAVTPTNTITTNQPTPPATNVTYTTNIFIAPYVPTEHTGSVTVGSLRLVANAEVLPESVTLRAAYVPRYIHQIRVHYQPNWPCVASLLSAGPGEILEGWGLSETNDGSGGRWLQISNTTTPILFGALGSLIKFSFTDMQTASNAFSFFVVDNSIYTNTGGQSFVLPSTNVNSFVTVYPALPYGTPVPWLIAHGFSSNWAQWEVADPDGDGMLNWQEYRANTDPNDPNSNLAFARTNALVRGPDGRYQVTFSSALNRSYRLDSSTDLDNSSTNLVKWVTVQDNIPGTGADITIIDTRFELGTTQLFYRVFLLPFP